MFAYHYSKLYYNLLNQWLMSVHQQPEDSNYVKGWIRVILKWNIKFFFFVSYKGHPELENLWAAHYQWLSETAQEEKAGEVRKHC